MKMENWVPVGLWTASTHSLFCTLMIRLRTIPAWRTETSTILVLDHGFHTSRSLNLESRDRLGVEEEYLHMSRSWLTFPFEANNARIQETENEKPQRQSRRKTPMFSSMKSRDSPISFFCASHPISAGIPIWTLEMPALLPLTHLPSRLEDVLESTYILPSLKYPLGIPSFYHVAWRRRSCQYR